MLHALPRRKEFLLTCVGATSATVHSHTPTVMRDMRSETIGNAPFHCDFLYLSSLLAQVSSELQVCMEGVVLG